MKFSFIALALMLTSVQAFAQDEKFEVGLSSSRLINLQTNVQGASFNYVTDGGLIVPVRIGFGNGVQQMSIGAGKRFQIQKSLSYSVAAALGNLRLDERFEVNKKDQERIAIELQNELNFQISNKLSLGFNYNLDAFNFMEVLNSKNEEPGPQDTQEDLALRTQRLMNRSHSNFGVSLRINIGK